MPNANKVFLILFFIFTFNLIIVFYYCKIKNSKMIIHKTQGSFFLNQTQVWVLYSGIWGNTETDGEWIGWSVPHDEWSNSYFEPPHSIPSLYFPQLGLYSCHHYLTLKHQIKSMIDAGINAILLTWTSHNQFLDQTLKYFLRLSTKLPFQISIIIPEYTNRSILTLYQDISTFISSYSSEESILKVNNYPIIIIENTYNILNLAKENISAHIKYFDINENFYINENINNYNNFFKKTDYQQLISKLKLSNKNSFLLGTGSSKNEAFNALDDGFNGFVSYYPSDYFSTLADPNTWKFDVHDFKSRKFLYIPTVSPGFNMSAKNIKFSKLSRSRRGGIRYEQQWKKAIDSEPEVILINSFNNWHYGTSIEPISVDNPQFPIDNNIWAGNNSQAFMILTKKWIKIYQK